LCIIYKSYVIQTWILTTTFVAKEEMPN